MRLRHNTIETERSEHNLKSEKNKNVLANSHTHIIALERVRKNVTEQQQNTALYMTGTLKHAASYNQSSLDCYCVAVKLFVRLSERRGGGRIISRIFIRSQ
jgi:hypothetical protein